MWQIKFVFVHVNVTREKGERFARIASLNTLLDFDFLSAYDPT
jgi:hypothetical protein